MAKLIPVDVFDFGVNDNLVEPGGLDLDFGFGILQHGTSPDLVTSSGIPSVLELAEATDVRAGFFLGFEPADGGPRKGLSADATLTNLSIVPEPSVFALLGLAGSIAMGIRRARSPRVGADRQGRIQ